MFNKSFSFSDNDRPIDDDDGDHIMNNEDDDNNNSFQRHEEEEDDNDSDDDNNENIIEENINNDNPFRRHGKTANGDDDDQTENILEDENNDNPFERHEDAKPEEAYSQVIHRKNMEISRFQISKLKPLSFLSDFKNPCFYQKEYGK